MNLKSSSVATNGSEKRSVTSGDRKKGSKNTSKASSQVTVANFNNHMFNETLLVSANRLSAANSEASTSSTVSTSSTNHKTCSLFAAFGSLFSSCKKNKDKKGSKSKSKSEKKEEKKKKDERKTSNFEGLLSILYSSKDYVNKLNRSKTSSSGKESSIQDERSKNNRASVRLSTYSNDYHQYILQQQVQAQRSKHASGGSLTVGSGNTSSSPKNNTKTASRNSALLINRNSMNRNSGYISDKIDFFLTNTNTNEILYNREPSVHKLESSVEPLTNQQNQLNNQKKRQSSYSMKSNASGGGAVLPVSSQTNKQMNRLSKKSLEESLDGLDQKRKSVYSICSEDRNITIVHVKSSGELTNEEKIAANSVEQRLSQALDNINNLIDNGNCVNCNITNNTTLILPIAKDSTLTLEQIINQSDMIAVPQQSSSRPRSIIIIETNNPTNDQLIANILDSNPEAAFEKKRQSQNGSIGTGTGSTTSTQSQTSSTEFNLATTSQNTTRDNTAANNGMVDLADLGFQIDDDEEDEDEIYPDDELINGEETPLNGEEVEDKIEDDDAEFDEELDDLRRKNLFDIYNDYTHSIPVEGASPDAATAAAPTSNSNGHVKKKSNVFNNSMESAGGDSTHSSDSQGSSSSSNVTGKIDDALSCKNNLELLTKELNKMLDDIETQKFIINDKEIYFLNRIQNFRLLEQIKEEEDDFLEDEIYDDENDYEDFEDEEEQEAEYSDEPLHVDKRSAQIFDAKQADTAPKKPAHFNRIEEDDEEEESIGFYESSLKMNEKNNGNSVHDNKKTQISSDLAKSTSLVSTISNSSSLNGSTTSAYSSAGNIYSLSPSNSTSASALYTAPSPISNKKYFLKNNEQLKPLSESEELELMQESNLKLFKNAAEANESPQSPKKELVNKSSSSLKKKNTNAAQTVTTETSTSTKTKKKKKQNGTASIGTHSSIPTSTSNSNLKQAINAKVAKKYNKKKLKLNKKHKHLSKETMTSASSTGSLAKLMKKSNVYEDYVIYEFQFPRKFCGKLIGKNGCHVDYVRNKTNTQIAIRNDPLADELQIVSITGRLEDVDESLNIITKRFPSKFYPNVSFKPISKPIIYRRLMTDDTESLFANTGEHESKILVTSNMFVDYLQIMPDLSKLTESQIHMDKELASQAINVYVTSIVNATHVFIQFPTNPLFENLQKLDQTMLSVYNSMTDEASIPYMIEPIEYGTICVAPTYYGWHRAMVTNYTSREQVVKQISDYNEPCGLTTIKFLDYGGYLTIPANQLRQLRNDFMLLPFQAIECYLDGIYQFEENEEDGKEFLTQIVKNSILKAVMTGYAEDGIPLIKLFLTNELQQNCNLNSELVNYGYAFYLKDNESPIKTSMTGPPTSVSV